MLSSATAKSHQFKIANLKTLASTAISIDAEETVEHAFNIFHKHNISAIPVIKNSEVLGILTSLDFLQFVAFKETSQSIEDFSKLDALTIEHKSPTRFAYLREKVKNITFNRKVPCFDMNSPLHRVAIELSQHSCHQAIVKTVNDKITMVTQTDLAMFALENYQVVFGENEEITAADVIGNFLETGSKLIVVMESSNGLTAFKKMSLHNVYSMAIINEHGKIVSEINASDLKKVSITQLNSLRFGVLEFLEKISTEGSIPDAIIAHLNTTLHEILAKMIRFNSHHVWIVGGSEYPIGVVTLTDIMRLLCDRL